MYNVYGFGKRIVSYRKIAGYTQEELAVKLNITAQAVSKWENELSFPEITILPLLANSLNTTIEKLFGNEEESIRNSATKDHYVPRFPENKGGNLRLVHTFGGIACYSEKDVDVSNEDSVYFKDGSSANLKQLKIVNKGIGEICFDFIDEIPMYYTTSDMIKTEINEVFTNIDSIEMIVNNSDFKLMRSVDNKTYVKATGSPIFIAGLKLIKQEGVLSVKCEHENKSGGSSNNNNKVLISFGSDSGKSIHVFVGGSGDIVVGIPFEAGLATINGSANISFTDVNDFQAKINGSGDIQCRKIGNPQISINGSGSIDTKETFGYFKSQINGSGDITLGNGKLDTFEATIRGSGDIKAEKITARNANVAIDGTGDITIGRVIEESIEKHSKNSTIKVLSRG